MCSRRRCLSRPGLSFLVPPFLFMILVLFSCSHVAALMVTSLVTFKSHAGRTRICIKLIDFGAVLFLTREQIRTATTKAALARLPKTSPYHTGKCARFKIQVNASVLYRVHYYSMVGREACGGWRSRVRMARMENRVYTSCVYMRFSRVLYTRRTLIFCLWCREANYVTLYYALYCTCGTPCAPLLS